MKTDRRSFFSSGCRAWVPVFRIVWIHELRRLCPLQMEDRQSVPLILVSSACQIQRLTALFSNNDHFAFDSKKV